MTKYVQDPKLRTLAEIAGELGKIKFAKGAIGRQLQYVTIKVSQLRISADYQRFVQKSTIKKAGQFNYELCQPLFIALRPDGIYVIVDGQHKALMAFLAELPDDYELPCILFVHPEDSTLQQCVAKEAELFSQLNTTRKNTSTLDKIRAGLSYDDEEAQQFEENFISVGIQAEGIGYEFGPEVNGWAKAVESISKWKVVNTKKAVDFLEPIYNKQWNKEGFIDGSMIGGLAAIFNLLNALGKGKKANGLSHYMKEYLGRISVSKWTENTRGQSDVLIARRIVSKYNDLVNQGVFADKDFSVIGEETLSGVKLADPAKVSE